MTPEQKRDFEDFRLSLREGRNVIVSAKMHYLALFMKVEYRFSEPEIFHRYMHAFYRKHSVNTMEWTYGNDEDKQIIFKAELRPHLTVWPEGICDPFFQSLYQDRDKNYFEKVN